MSNNHISLAKLLQFQEDVVENNEVQKIKKHLNNCSLCKENFEKLKLEPNNEALSTTEADFIWEKINSGIKEEKKQSKIFRFSVKQKKLFLAAASISLILLSSLFLFKQTTDWQASHLILCQSQNPISVKSEGNKINIKNGYFIHAKTIFTTLQNGSADIKLANNSGIRIMSSSELSIKRISQSKEQKKINIYLKKGLVVARLDKKLSNTTFNLQTPHGLFKVIGTRFALQVTKKQTKLYLFEGKIEINNKVNQLANAISITKTDGNNITLLKADRDNSNFYSLEKLSRDITFIISKRKNKKNKKKKKITSHSITFRERLLLNDGSSITGTILKQEKEQVTIKTSYGIMHLKKSDIKKIIYVKSGAK